MLNKETVDYIKDNIKDINREKDFDTKVQRMITLKDEVRNNVNEQLDDLFSRINLKKLKINLD